MLRFSVASAVLLIGHFVLQGMKAPLSTSMWIFSSLVTAAFCYSSAIELLRFRAATIFAVLAMVIGWCMEQIGVTIGVPFGSYVYTEVLGPKLGSVPAIIPVMWFSFAYIGYVLANLTLWHRPTHASVSNQGWFYLVMLALTVGTLLAVYDLVADPYMVNVATAWVMLDPGSYFGETASGFFGWLLTGFLIIFSFQLVTRNLSDPQPTRIYRYSVLYPLFAFAFYIAFFIAQGEPLETRSIAFYAMGLPLLTAFVGWHRWSQAVAHRED